jgi:AsmA protein
VGVGTQEHGRTLRPISVRPRPPSTTRQGGHPKSTSGDPASSGPAPAPPKSAPAEPNSIEDLLERPGPQVKGFTQRSGWSAEPIELASLGLIDANAHLSIADMSYGQVRIDAADVSIGLKDRVLKATLTDVKLYDGTGHGLVTFDGTASDAAFAADVSMSGIAARPLLRDCAQIDWLAGSTNVAMKLSGRGASEAAIVQSLNGTADVAVNNGAVIGFNLDGAMSALAEGKIPDFRRRPPGADFSGMTGTRLANGIAATTI